MIFPKSKTKILLKSLHVLFIVFLYSESGASIDNNTQLSDILNKVEKTYSGMAHYHDSGRIGASYGVEIKFETYFMKKGNEKLFLYDWSKIKGRLNLASSGWLCSNQEGVFGQVVTSKTKDIEKYADLKDGIASYFLDSKGHLRLIPSLLFEDLGFPGLTSLYKIKLFRTEENDTESYFHVFISRDKDADKNGIHLWIDKNTFIIKKAKRVLNKSEIVYSFDTVEANKAFDDSIFQLPH